MKTISVTVLAAILVFICTGCGFTAESIQSTQDCQIVLEAADGITADSWVKSAENGEVSFALTVADGCMLTGADFSDYTIIRNAAGEGVTLTLHNVRYTKVVTLDVEQSPVVVNYVNGDEIVSVPVTRSREKVNTAPYGLFTRKGYTLYSWNTEPDGSGESTGLGSRVEYTEGLTLYAEWSRWSDENLFVWEQSGDGVAITGYIGSESVVTIPRELAGRRVLEIASGAFNGAECETVILPAGLMEVKAGAFENSSLSELYLFDDIVNISDYAFTGCSNLATLHINAVESPVYSGTYYDTFPDKLDRLLSLSDKRKIVLFSGSSARFGYDSSMIDEAFADYEVVNMGVFAYTNAYPQLMLILECMNDGDVLLVSPEFDAAKRQFCTTNALDAPFFAMVESDYDIVSMLDLREVTGVFAALSEYLSIKDGMEPRSYSVSPSDYDEDGNPTETPSYNEYGDYCLYRPNAASDEPVYGLAVEYTVAAFPKELYIDAANAMYERFLKKGVTVLFTYAPRNIYALSEDSTIEARAELDSFFRENLNIPVITDIEDSLFPGRLLYGTDNHLSTEGVTIRTETVIDGMREWITE